MARKEILRMVKGVSLIDRMKGIKHPDETISPKTRSLYLPSNAKFTPTGRFTENPMELYFGRSQRGGPKGVNELYGAVQKGYSEDQLEVVTGLSPQQVSAGLRYLRNRNLIKKEVI